MCISKTVISKDVDSMSKTDSFNEIEESKYLKEKKFLRKISRNKKIIKKRIFLSTLKNIPLSYPCVFSDCKKTFPTYFRWKIHYIIHVE